MWAKYAMKMLFKNMETHSLMTRDPQSETSVKTRMWANAQRHGHPAEYRWRPLFNAARFG